MVQHYTTSYPDPDLFLRKAVRVARHYGFVPLEQLVEKASPRTRVRSNNISEYRREFDGFSGELLSTLKRCLEHKMGKDGKPLAFSHTNLFSAKATPKTVFFGLQILGVEKSIAEALVLRAALAILEELGMKEVSVRLNSIGDRDSLAKLSKELSLFFRKNINTLPPPAQQALKRDVLEALEYVHHKGHEVSRSAPRPIEFLNESSRKHLREILEFLESFGVRYEIDDGLVGHRDCYSQTLFEIRPQGSPDAYAVARGGRYDELGRRLFRTQIPAVGVLFTCETKKRGKILDPSGTRARNPKVYFVHLGFDAKMRSLNIIDTLRKEHIPIEQSLAEDSLAAQILAAEERAVPYTVIMGQKEASEDTVIVRNMSTRSQETVTSQDLPLYLKRALR